MFCILLCVVMNGNISSAERRGFRVFDLFLIFPRNPIITFG